MDEYYSDPHRYDDIIDLPYHQSKTKPHMSLQDRAAQFGAFSALTGHDAAIQETARLTDEKITLDTSKITEINEKLAYITEHLSENLPVSITYFRDDPKKQGGAYLTDVGIIKKIDAASGLVTMENGIQIKMDDISNITIIEDAMF